MQFFSFKMTSCYQHSQNYHRVTTAILCKFKSLVVLGEYLSPNNLKFSNNNIQRFETSHPSGIMSQRCNYIKLLKTSNTNDRSYKICAKISKKEVLSYSFSINPLFGSIFFFVNGYHIEYSAENMF